MLIFVLAFMLTACFKDRQVTAPCEVVLDTLFVDENGRPIAYLESCR